MPDNNTHCKISITFDLFFFHFVYRVFLLWSFSNFWGRNITSIRAISHSQTSHLIINSMCFASVQIKVFLDTFNANKGIVTKFSAILLFLCEIWKHHAKALEMKDYLPTASTIITFWNIEHQSQCCLNVDGSQSERVTCCCHTLNSEYFKTFVKISLFLTNSWWWQLRSAYGIADLINPLWHKEITFLMLINHQNI